MVAGSAAASHDKRPVSLQKWLAIDSAYNNIAGVTMTATPNVRMPVTNTALMRHQQLVSITGQLAVIILREPDAPGTLLCDGRPLIAAAPAPCSTRMMPIESGDLWPGARLADGESGLTILCPRGGSGQLTFDGRPLRRISLAPVRDTCTR